MGCRRAVRGYGCCDGSRPELSAAPVPAGSALPGGGGGGRTVKRRRRSREVPFCRAALLHAGRRWIKKVQGHVFPPTRGNLTVPSQPKNVPPAGGGFPKDAAPGHPAHSSAATADAGGAPRGNLEQTGPKGLWLGGHLGQWQGVLEMAAVILASFGGVIVHRDTWKLGTTILEFSLGYLNGEGIALSNRSCVFVTNPSASFLILF